ncbi:MAG: phosphoribosylaminoimidazolesuccinocarboxamide synthase [Peptoniphilus sp.]|nr:phosphoribosylaminoimidazolesuccinocarboxamide synthase [Peptoniphilus sp.]MDD7363604.1 phosphoribosylaminoimidazolesuccinocarboxamide synthase [Bacillota bacterium]MDY6045205.1 phosphoribosylaminoimidazolesuccinocarboxamide synthase [Peptoniphilus sp.]
MKTIYEGKTKDIRKDGDKTYFFFKDDVTGKDGVFDPGENQVGLSIEGSGRACIAMSKYYFEKFNDENIPTHYVAADVDERLMEIKPATVFGKGLEVICRYKSTGSFMRRYGLYAEEGQDLNGYVEFTLKDDARQDPLINEDALVLLGILKEGEYDTIKELTRSISKVIADDLAERGLTLYDIKLEFGRLEGSDDIVLIDEVSGGNMRVYKGDEYIEPLRLSKMIVGE